MSAILCRWLNDDVGLRQRVDPGSFARDFANGVLFGEVLHHYGVQPDYDQFARGSTSEARLGNFKRLEPALRRLNVALDVNMARDIMSEKSGAANRLAYQIYVAVGKRQKQGGHVPVKPEQTTSAMQQLFNNALTQRTPRQTDLQYQELEARFREKQKRQEEAALRVEQAEQARAEAARKKKHHEALERSRQIKRQFEDRVKAWKAAPSASERDPNRYASTIPRATRRRPPSAGERSDATRIPIAPFPEPLPKIDKESSEMIGAIRVRKIEEEEARKEREKRRRRAVIRELQAQDSLENERREALLLGKILKQSQQERRIAAQLMQTRQEKEIIRQNRLYREQQAAERRRKDFEEALDREKELARQAKAEYEAQVADEVARVKALRARQREAEIAARTEVCRDIVNDVIDLACKCADYRDKTQRNLPPALMREWMRLFTANLPLAPPDASQSDDEPSSTDKISEVLDDQALLDYKQLAGEWEAAAAAPCSEAETAVAPAPPNPVLAHVVRKLIDTVRPQPPALEPPQYPAARVKAAVVGKAFAGKTAALKAASATLGLHIIDPNALLSQALQAHERGETQTRDAGADMFELDECVAEHLQEFRHPRLRRKPVTVTDMEAEVAALAAAEQSKREEDEAQGEASDDKAVPPAAAEPAATDAEASTTTTTAAPTTEESTAAPAPAAPVPLPTPRARLGQEAADALAMGEAVSDDLLVRLIALEISTLPEGSGWVLDGFPSTPQQAQLLEKSLSGFRDALPEPALRSVAADGVDTLLVDEPAPGPDEPSPEPSPSSPSTPTPTSLLDLVLVLDADDETALQRAVGRRIDPATGEEYHLENRPPPSVSDASADTAAVLGTQERLEAVPDAAHDQEQLQHRLASWSEAGAGMLAWYAKFGIVESVDANAEPSAVGQSVQERLVYAAGKDERLAQADAEAKVAFDAQMVQDCLAEAAAVLAAQHSMEAELDAAEQAEAEAERAARASEEAAAADAGKGKKGGAAGGKGGAKKGGKGGAEAEPTLADLEAQLTALSEAESKEAAAAAAAARPKAGDPGYAFCPLTVSESMAVCLAPTWDLAEDAYIGTSKLVFAQLREERERMIAFLHNTRQDFAAYLARPDHKQEFVSRWQEAYNAIPADMRCDSETKAELHKRVEDLRETLLDICDTRRDEAEKECKSIIKDMWVEDHSGILCNYFVTLMQAEVDRFHETQALLQDYYDGVKGAIPAERSGPAGGGLQIPLLDLSQPLADAEADAKTATKSKSKGSGAPVFEPITSEDGQGIPLLKRPNALPETDALVIDNAASTALGVIKPREDPAALRAKRAEQEEKAKAEAAKAAAGGKGGAKDKKGKKTPMPEEPPPPPPTEAELEAAAAAAAHQALLDAADDELYAAAQAEDARLRARVELIRRQAQRCIKELHERGAATFADLDTWIGRRYKLEVDCIAALCDTARTAIEEEQMIQHELILDTEAFVIDESVSMFEPPEPERPPTVKEGWHVDRFRLEQLEELAGQFALVAPGGMLPKKQFIDFLQTLVATCSDLLPESWTAAGAVDSGKLRNLADTLAPESALVDWRLFLFHALDVGEPTLAQLQALRDVLMEKETLDEATFEKLTLWFEKDEGAPVSASVFNRNAHAKPVLFRILAEDGLVDSLTLVCVGSGQLLCASCSAKEGAGLRRAAALVSAGHPDKLPLDADQLHMLLHFGRSGGALDAAFSLDNIVLVVENILGTTNTDEDAVVPFDALFAAEAALPVHRQMQALAGRLFQRVVNVGDATKL